MMNDREPDDEPDEFAARLRAQPPPELPAHWRGEILAAANAALPSPPAVASPWRDLTREILSWLWPHPLAYAALLTGWAVAGFFWLLTWPLNPAAASRPPLAAADHALPDDPAHPSAGSSNGQFASLGYNHSDLSWQ